MARNLTNRLGVGGWLLAAGFGLLAALTPDVRAEMDYEFAKMLMDDNEASFSTDDMVEQLIAQLDRVSTTKTEGKLIKAMFRRKQAGTASVEKKKALLDEADGLFREVSADKTYRLRDVAEKELGTINSYRATAMMKAAIELEKTNPAEARRMRGEAVATLGKLADAHKTESTELRTKFDAVYKTYKTWGEKENKTGDKPIPKDLLDKLMGTFNPWLLADKRYVATKVEQVECYDDTDGAKKKEGEELAKLCKARADLEDVTEFPVIVAWYNYMRGRAWAAIQNEKEAADAWKETLDQPEGDLQADQKKAVFALKKMILHDLVKMKMRAKKYGDVENVIVEAKVSPDLRSLFDEDSGKGLMVDYAKALTLPNDATSAEYEKAIKELRGMIQKETKGGAATKWSNEFSRTIAELLEEARGKPAVRPKLTAAEWYDAAHGFFLMGQQEYLKFQDLDKDKSPKAAAQFEKTYGEYQNAVDYFRRAIAAARSEKTDLATRVEVESKSWFEMGLSYLKMRHNYEAIIAYQAMRDTFLPDARKRWLPKLDDFKVIKPPVAKQVTELLTELDKPKEGLLAKSGSNIIFALDKNLQAHANAKDGWNPQLKVRIMGGDSGIVDDNSVTDVKYIASKNDMDEAKRLSVAGSEALKAKEAKLAEENYTLSVAKYASAGEKFTKVDTTSKAYELALYQAGSAYTMAQALYVTGKLPSKPMKDAFEQAKEMGKRAIEAFDKYDAYLAKASGTDEDKTRRQKLAGMVLLARNALYSGAGDWEKVIKSADEYVAWESQNPQPKTSVDVALMNKYRAEIEMAAANWAPKGDPYLAEGEKAMREWRKIKDKDNKTFVYMLEALARRVNMAAFQVEKFMKDGKKEFTTEMMEVYENKVADLWSERMGMIEEAEGQQQDTTLEDYTRVVYLFTKTRRDRQAADYAKKLLEKFDPQNKNCRIADDEKVWQALLAKMQSVIRYNDLAKWDRAKKDHATLVDYMYDTREGAANAEHPEKRPDYDKFNLDMEKARAQLETIRKNYPDCQTFDPKFGENGKSLLGTIEEEIDFRRKIEATRDLLFNKALLVAKQLDDDGQKDEAKRYRETANVQIDILRQLRGDTPDMAIKSAVIAVSIGKYDDALAKLNDVKNEVPAESALYFDASRMESEVYALQKKWRDAATYPEFIATTATFDSKLVKDRWPEMKAFLTDCYAHGAPCPEPLKKLLKAKAAGGKTEEGKKEEGKVEKDAATKDEPKADEKKADTPKADEKKADKPKAEEKAADEKKADAPKAEEKKADEKKAAEPEAKAPAAPAQADEKKNP